MKNELVLTSYFTNFPVNVVMIKKNRCQDYFDGSTLMIGILNNKDENSNAVKLLT